MSNKKIYICFKINGGVGTVLARFNFVKCFYDKFKDKVIIDIYGHASQEINEGIVQGYSFFKNVYPSYVYKDEISSIYDVIITLDALPLIKNYESVERDKVKSVSYSLHKIFLSWNDFFRNPGNEKYYRWIRESKTDLYMHLLNKKATVLDSPDIFKDLNIDPKNYSLILNCNDYRKLLSINKLKPNEFITIQYGCNPKLGTNNIPKIWPKIYFEKLVSLLKVKYPKKKIVQLGEGDSLESQIKGTDISFLNNTNFEELKYILKCSYLHIDSECGMVHMRKALNAGPSVVFFGPTPIKFFEYEGNINISSGKCVSWCAEIDSTWEIKCPLGYKEPTCMFSITPEYVIQRIEEWESNKKKDIIIRKLSLKEKIYDKYGFTLDKEYYERWLSKQVVLGFHDDFVKLQDLFFIKYNGCLNGHNSFEYVSLVDSYVYKYLCGDKKSYYDEQRIRATLDDNPYSERRLLKLIESLNNEIDTNNVILIDEYNNILDGFHRASYMMSKYGKEHEIRVLRIYLPYCK